MAFVRLLCTWELRGDMLRALRLPPMAANRIRSSLLKVLGGGQVCPWLLARFSGWKTTRNRWIRASTTPPKTTRKEGGQVLIYQFLLLPPVAQLELADNRQRRVHRRSRVKRMIGIFIARMLQHNYQNCCNSLAILTIFHRPRRTPPR